MTDKKVLELEERAQKEIEKITGMRVFRGGAYLSADYAREISNHPQKWMNRRLTAADALALQSLWDLCMSLMQEKIAREGKSRD